MRYRCNHLYNQHKDLKMNNATIIIISFVLITILLAGGIYILINEYFKIFFQKMRFANTLSQHKSSDSKNKSIGDYILDFIDQFNLQEFFKVDNIKKTLSDTGNSTTMTLDKILLAKIVLPICIGFIIFNSNFVGMFMNEDKPEFRLVSIIFSVVIGLMTFPLPNILIEMDAKKRAADFMITFPSVLDLLIICIQSGISFEHALQRVTRDATIISPVVGEELSRILKDIHLLGSREAALLNFKRRIPTAAVDDFVLVVLQSERYGTSMSDALHVLSETVRFDQITIIERIVLKLPTKISAIIMVFMMPAVLILVFAPILLGGISAGF